MDLEVFSDAETVAWRVTVRAAAGRVGSNWAGRANDGSEPLN